MRLLLLLLGRCLLRREPVERAQRLGRLPAERADERAVVLVRGRARAVVELEFLQRRERAVALLEQREPPYLGLVADVQLVALRLRVAEEGPCDVEDARRGERDAEDERDCGHASAGASAVRAASRRCSRASGQSVISAPSTKTSPAIHTRLTSGLTKTLK